MRGVRDPISKRLIKTCGPYRVRSQSQDRIGCGGAAFKFAHEQAAEVHAAVVGMHINVTQSADLRVSHVWIGRYPTDGNEPGIQDDAQEELGGLAELKPSVFKLDDESAQELESLCRCYSGQFPNRFEIGAGQRSDCWGHVFMPALIP
jgi:hypothetical protein